MLGTVRGGVTATAGVITAVLGAVFLVFPAWRPLPRDKIEASVNVAEVEHNVGLRAWAARQFPDDPHGHLRKLLGYDDLDRVRASKGMVLYVVLTTDGFKRRSLKLRTRVYDVATGEPAQLEAPRLLPRASDLKIDAPSRSSVQLLILSELQGLGGRYRVRVEAYDGAGILAYGDSPVIKG
jgi:hypothetical protein